MEPARDCAPPEGGEDFVLVGRENELGLLLTTLPRTPSVVMVEGEAGVGKSRLVREATTALTGRGTRVTVGFCHRLREPLPFGPVLEALRAVADGLPPPQDLDPRIGVLAPLLPELTDRLPAAPVQPDDARGRRFQQVGAVRSILEVLGPVVLVVEDVHWADEATRELLLLLAVDPPSGLSLVLTYRDEDLPSGVPVLGTPYRRPSGIGGTDIHLDTLTEADLHHLATAVLGHRATRALARALHRRSAGLPLVAEEDLLTLRQRQGGATGPVGDESREADPCADTASHASIDLTDPDASADRTPTADPVFGAAPDDDTAALAQTAVPRYLRQALGTRLAALSPESLAVVQAAAVLAVPAQQNLLTEVSGLQSDRAAVGLTEALRATVLREDTPTCYGFRHTLAQQTIYRDVPGPRRQDLHRRAVRTLWARPSPPLVQIAYHTRALGDVQAWLRQAESAAEQAVAIGDDGTAATLINEILAEPSLEADRRTHAALALARIAKEGVERSTTATLRRILTDPQLPAAARGEIRLTLGVLLLNQASDRTGLVELEQAVDELESRPDLAARAMAALAIGEQNRSPEGTQVWAERLDALMDQVERSMRDAPDERVWAAVCGTRASLLAKAGDPSMWELVEKLPRRSTDDEVMWHTARALHNVGDGAVQTGYDERAAGLLAQSRDLAHRLGHHLLECFSRLALLRLDWLAGRWNTLEDDIRRLGDEFPDVTAITVEGLLDGGNLSAARGQWQGALDQLGRAAVLGEKSSEDDLIFRAVAGTARIHLLRGEPEAAWSAVAPALELLRHVTVWLQAGELLSIAVRAALACGHHDRAQELTVAAEQVVAGRDAPAVEAELHLARGLLLQYGPDPDRAGEHFDRARLLYEAIGRTYFAAQATELLAATRVAVAPATATACFTDAATTFTALGAVADAARCQQALRDLGLSRPAPRGRRGYGTALSPRERQVADLLAHGASNQDIAQALSLSKRTVEVHVANTLKKLRTTRDRIAGTTAAG